jgi:hypothetical protein
MTTSWSHAARGNVSGALAANGGGAVLFVLAVAAAPWLIASAIVGQLLAGRPSLPLLLAIGGAWLTVVVLDWARRLATS